ncbi:MAG: hypothetical protein R6U31_06070 [bacterium]
MSIVFNNIPVSRLSDDDMHNMYELFNRYFIYDYRSFAEDIHNKSIITLICDNENDNLIGFSSYDKSIYDEFAILFSGSTVVSEQYRNERALMEGFLSVCSDMIKAYSDRPVYWHLLSMGFRTYRFLPLFFNEYYPCRKGSYEMKGILDRVSYDRFGDLYDPATGIVSIPGGERLRPQYAEIPRNRLNDRHVRFFLEKNPDYRQGNELSCIAKISVNNMKSIPQKILKGFIYD